ncbi:hypothetical protein BSL78_20072 [Apostichopus japonicus]|uniref:Ig-like domain-containing protein n=1 Tax=Stichopus japonicus TaxID=307972 RepID=A0A2G8K4W8_STIJA|nr:hypothetical protein BSL78_20072 [Apostichopus japonicus]
MDGEYNEVVFVGETDITLRCSYNGNLTIETVTIMDQNGNNVTEEIKKIFAEYRINTAAISDGGMYKCNVRYTCMDGREVTEVTKLDVNVKFDTSPQCVRNGTVGEPYKPGDWILLSCYCREIETCSWISSVEGSGQSDTLSPFDEIVIHKGKVIRRVIVHYKSSTDPNTKYVCFSGQTETSRCEIGPQSKSSNDFIINSMETVTSTDICSPPTTESMSKEVIFLDSMTSKATEMRDTTNRVNMDNSVQQNTNNMSYTVFVISGSVVTLLTVVIVILTVFILCGGRNKRDQKARVDNMTRNNTYKEDNEANRNTPHYNSAFIHSSSSVVSDDNCNGITDDSHTYDSPPMNIMNEAVTSVPDETYGEVESTKLPDVTKTGSAKRSRDDDSGKVRFAASDFQRRPTPSERRNRGSGLDNNDVEEDISMLYAKIDKSKRKSTLLGRRPTTVCDDDVNDVYAKVDN